MGSHNQRPFYSGLGVNSSFWLSLFRVAGSSGRGTHMHYQILSGTVAGKVETKV